MHVTSIFHQESHAEVWLGLSADGRAVAAFSPAAQPLGSPLPSVSPSPVWHMLLVASVEAQR